jgi:hypothetical protein
MGRPALTHESLTVRDFTTGTLDSTSTSDSASTAATTQGLFACSLANPKNLVGQTEESPRSIGLSFA